MQDILSTFVSDNFTAALVNKLYRLALIVLILSSIYWALDFIDWYSILHKVSPSSRNRETNFYLYRVRPVIIIIDMIISMAGHILNYKGYACLNNSLKNHDTQLLHKGFRQFQLTYILAIISFAIAIINILYRIMR